jgi:hypothetical protein
MTRGRRSKCEGRAKKKLLRSDRGLNSEREGIYRIWNGSRKELASGSIRISGSVKRK